MIFLTLTQGAVCACVLIMCVLILNRMNRATRHAIRAAFIFLTVAAGVGLLLAGAGNPDPATTFMSVGVAVFLVVNTRRVKGVRS